MLMFFFFQIGNIAFFMSMAVVTKGAVPFEKRNDLQQYLSPIHLPDQEPSDVTFNGNDNSRFNSSSMRFPTPRDWSCETAIEWRDLGDNHFPRYVREVKCAGTTCFHGFYSCHEETYQVEVLTVRRHTSRTLFGSAVPSRLRHSWRFKAIPVPVACVCVEH